MKGQIHEWREAQDDGQMRIVRCVRTPRGWRFEETFKTAPDWWDLEKPSRNDFVTLRDALWRKYQRGRVPHEVVVEVDKILEGMEEEEPKEHTSD